MGLRIAVAGTGFIGRVHARSARLAGAELAGVAASSPESAERAAAELGAARAFASADELVTADGIDVVHLCTPNHLHEPLALAALAAGKHVVCEKPVALDGDGARRIAAAAADAGRVVAVPFVYRFHPLVREARARVAAGELGPVRVLHGTYLQDWLLGADDTNWRVEPGLGGASRAFADIGSHWCDLVEFTSGARITRLLAHTATTVSSRATGDRPTFAAAGGAGPAPAPSPPRTSPPRTSPWSCSRRMPGGAGRSSSRRCRRGGRTASRSSSTGPRPRSPSTRSGPSCSGSAGARAPRSCPATPPTWPRTPPAWPRCLRATARATTTVSTSSWRTPTPPCPGWRPRACPWSVTACGPPPSPTPCWRRPVPSPGSRCRREARVPDRLPAEALARRHRRLGGGPRLRRPRGGRLARPRRPPIHRHARRRHGAVVRWGRRRLPRHVRQARADRVVAGVLRQQPPPRPGGARGDQRPRPRLHRRRRRARRAHGRHVRGPAPGPVRPGEPDAGRGGVPAHRRPGRRAGREGHRRELRDGGLAPRRLPGQPRLLARA